MANTSIATDWAALNPSRVKQLTDARLQVHYATQFAAAVGISYLTARPDDSHTNMDWDPRLEALRSRELRALSHAVRVALRPRDLTLFVLLDGAIGQQIPLHGSTIGQVESTLRAALAACGLDGRRLTMRRHYNLPSHPVAGGDAFDTTRREEFVELARWFGNAAGILGELRARTGSSEVRCWPHHFDIATLATIPPSGSCGAGMDPGDDMFPEPYYYVNARPAPSHPPTAPLDGGGIWHTDGWVGAVLPGSRLTSDAAGQEAQVRAFLNSAVEACTRLVTG